MLNQLEASGSEVGDWGSVEGRGPALPVPRRVMEEHGVTDKGSRVVSVEIHGQRYPIRSSSGTGVRGGARRVRRRQDADSGRRDDIGDTLKIAVLAALNIADEYFRCHRGDEGPAGLLLQRAGEIERLVDRVLAGASREDR